MNNEEKILQLLENQQEELRKINTRLDSMETRLDSMETRLDSMETRLDKLEEHAEVTRAGVNSLLEWAEECGNVIKFPLPKVK